MCIRDRDVTTDYNATRNTHYKLTLKFKGYGNDADWHIERLELELRQRQEADSVKHLKDFNYDDERKTE